MVNIMACGRFAILRYMKSLSLARPLVLIMIGVPGAGKSFFARQFADTFNAPLVSEDYIRASIFENPGYNREENSLVQAIFLQQITELLKTQRTFLIDGGMNARAERYELKKQVHDRGYGTLTIWVQTDEATSRFRSTRRSTRRRGDAYNQSLSEQQFSHLAKRLAGPSAQEDYVVISGKHTYATQARAVLKKIVTPRETAASHQEPSRQVHPGNEQSSSTHTPRRHNVIIN